MAIAMGAAVYVNSAPRGPSARPGDYGRMLHLRTRAVHRRRIFEPS